MPLVVGIKDEKGLLSGRQIHGYNTAWRIMESQSRQLSRRQYTQSGLQEAELSEQSHENVVSVIICAIGNQAREMVRSHQDF